LCSHPSASPSRSSLRTREVGRTPLRSPAAGGRDGSDGSDAARQWTEAARARETRGKGAVDLDLLRGKGVFDSGSYPRGVKDLNRGIFP
jgi:hypothetical protein